MVISKLLLPAYTNQQRETALVTGNLTFQQDIQINGTSRCN